MRRRQWRGRVCISGEARWRRGAVVLLAASLAAAMAAPWSGPVAARVAAAQVRGSTVSTPPVPLKLAGGAVVAGPRSVVLEGGRRVTVQVAEVDLDRAEVRVALARGRVGQVEELASLAARHGAVAAVNGSFFNAYAPKLPRLPSGTIMVDGRVVHLGTSGSVAAFGPDGAVDIRSARPEFDGFVDARVEHWWEEYRRKWWVSYVNRPPEGPGKEAVHIFTPDYFYDDTRVGDGLQVVVREGRVAWVVRGKPAWIQRDGFVVLLAGASAAKLGDRFLLGTEVRYGLRFRDRWTGEALPWEGMRWMVTAGPELVRDARVTVTPETVAREGFTEPKITRLTLNRSAIGVTADRRLLLVTTPALTVYDLGKVMRALGAVAAMNLDGGGSSGLWVAESQARPPAAAIRLAAGTSAQPAGLPGRYLTRPGRPISNAILILPR